MITWISSILLHGVLTSQPVITTNGDIHSFGDASCQPVITSNRQELLTAAALGLLHAPNGNGDDNNNSNK